MLIKRLHPDVAIVGIDPDPKALARARRKASRAAVSIQFEQGFGDELPYPEASFDRVFSSFMFHHLPSAEKGKTLHAVRRVLKPGVRFICSISRGLRAALMVFSPIYFRLKENSENEVLTLMKQSGFSDPRKVDEQAMFFGRMAYFRAVRDETASLIENR